MKHSNARYAHLIRLPAAIRGGGIHDEHKYRDFLSERGRYCRQQPRRGISPFSRLLVASCLLFPFIGPHTVPGRLHASLGPQSRNMSRRLGHCFDHQPFDECATFGKSVKQGLKRGMLETSRDRSKLSAKEVSRIRELR